MNSKMNFYRLGHPKYKTDHAHTAANPARQIDQLAIPGIICSVCGSQWSGNRKLYIPVTDPSLRPLLQSGPLPEEQWLQVTQTIRSRLNLPHDFQFLPGNKLGTPVYELTRTRVFEFVHPFPATLLVKSAVVDALQAAGFTGYKTLQVEVHWAMRIKNKMLTMLEHLAVPELYVLQVTGSAWHTGVNEDSVTFCRHCHRTKPPIVNIYTLDESQWASPDFMHVDLNPDKVIVTERVCDCLRAHNFTN